MKSRYLHAYLMFICLFGWQFAHAIEPQGINLGALKLTPQLVVTHVNDSNIYLSNENLEEEQNSKITLINPSLSLSAKDRSREYSSNLSFTSGSYSETRGGDDDYLDYRFSVTGKFPLIHRQTFLFNAGRDSLHDNRGTAFTAGAAATVSEPDEYNQDKVGIKYSFGNNFSKMGVDLGIEYSQKEYTNNETTTGNRNYNMQQIDWKYFYQTQSKLKTFLQLSTKDIDYKVDNPIPGLSVQTFDGTQHAGYVGLEWKTTAKTTGIAKIGASNKKFDDPLVEDIDTTDSWELDINYEATARTQLSIGSSAMLFENEGSGNAKESQSYSAGWSQRWPRQLSSNLNYSLTQDVHSGSDREDDTSTVDINITYSFRRWMDFKIGHTNITRESSDDAFEYNKNVYQISVIASL